jgi:hypothetical protein
MGMEPNSLGPNILLLITFLTPCSCLHLTAYNPIELVLLNDPVYATGRTLCGMLRWLLGECQSAALPVSYCLNPPRPQLFR